MGRRPSTRRPLADSRKAGLVLLGVLCGASACGLGQPGGHSTTEPFGPVCDELAGLALPPSRWITSDGRLALDADGSTRMMIAFGIGAAATGSDLQATLRDVLSSRIGGRSHPLAMDERTAIDRLQSWLDEDCSSFGRSEGGPP